MINKENLISCIQRAKKITLVVPSSGEFPNHQFIECELNDFVLHIDGTLELWENSSGYEI
jgi:hypothetical protein